MKIVTAAEMRSLDARATTISRIPSLLLMENAARGIVDQIEVAIGSVKGKTVIVVAGRGNNGGDGLAAARHLRMRGAIVRVYLPSPIELITGDARTSLNIWQATRGVLIAGGAFSPDRLCADLKNADLVIDALLGTGLSKAVTGNYAEAIKAINGYAQTVIAIDIPSGISADTGAVLGHAVKAKMTMTMALPKWGHFLQEGLECRGDLSVVDIGIPPALIEQAAIKVDLITPSRVSTLLPARPKQSHKGSMGHLLVIAGSPGKVGAAQMTSLAALRCGAGLVTCALPKSLASAASFPTMEVMTLPLSESEKQSLALSAEKEILDASLGKRAIAIGPGLSQDSETQDLVRDLIAKITTTMVLDADAINALAEDLDCLKLKKAALILTPHPGEMGRLVGKSASEVQEDRFNIAADFAKTWGVILVLKGAHTVIAAPDGSLQINNTGNSGMATAGVGDVLTGVIAGYLAQGLYPLDAATLGVYHHGLAGDLAREVTGEAGLLASDLIRKLPEAGLKINRN